ncbi:MAG: tRNA lysidine(34) synthetase TilS [Candidatus Binataceae bacterium]|nr:tRNA lysidine(34) synthetase TilS [Candidatus Binataceae bacterium]
MQYRQAGRQSNYLRIERSIERALAPLKLGTGDFILAAISGGSDSIALLHAIKRISERFGFRIAAAHLNHRLRGAESDRDEAFVRQTCSRLGVELIVEQADLIGSANLEERARECRYAFLARAAESIGAKYVALGHHADDRAETIMMRLMRGSGISGLVTMNERGPGRLIRPLLNLTRVELLDYLRALGAEFVSDSSNLSPRHLRNRVRNDLLTLIDRDYAPNFSHRLLELAEDLRSIDHFLSLHARNEMSKRLTPDGRLRIEDFNLLHRAVAAAMLRNYIANRTGDLRKIYRRHIESIMKLCGEGPPNGHTALPGGWVAVREYGDFIIRRAAKTGNVGYRASYSVPIASVGRTEIEPAGFAVEAELLDLEAASRPSDLYTALFDCAEIEGGLLARNAVPGDRIAPLGMAGHRKVKNLFIDARVPRDRRASYPLLCAGSEVLWIPGLVRSRFALFSSKTRKLLRLRAFPLTR